MAPASRAGARTKTTLRMRRNLNGEGGTEGGKEEQQVDQGRPDHGAPGVDRRGHLPEAGRADTSSPSRRSPHKELKKNGIFVLPGFAKFVVVKPSRSLRRARGSTPSPKRRTTSPAKPASKVVRARPGEGPRALRSLVSLLSSSPMECTGAAHRGARCASGYRVPRTPPATGGGSSSACCSPHRSLSPFELRLRLPVRLEVRARPTRNRRTAPDRASAVSAVFA